MRVADLRICLSDDLPFFFFFYFLTQLITDVKVLDSEEKGVVKPPFQYGDAIPHDDFNEVTEECCWLQKVEDRRIFLPSMVCRYSILGFQHESIMRIMGKPILAHRDGVAFGIINRR